MVTGRYGIVKADRAFERRLVGADAGTRIAAGVEDLDRDGLANGCGTIAR